MGLLHARERSTCVTRTQYGTGAVPAGGLTSVSSTRASAGPSGIGAGPTSTWQPCPPAGTRVGLASTASTAKPNVTRAL